MKSYKARSARGEKLLRKCLFAMSVIGFIASATQVGAETRADKTGSASTAIELVTVTATKREENIQNVPSHVVAISDVDLTNNKIETPLQLANAVPNFVADTAAGRDQTDVFLRGVGTFAYNPGTSSAVSSYQDQFYLNSHILNSEPYFDLERVEVLFGPQGTIWGQNSTAGAINVVTKKPTDNFDGFGTITYGAYNELDLEGAVGGALVPDKLSARFAFTRQSSDGWVHNDFNGATLGGYSDTAARAQFLWTPTDTLSVLVKVHGRELTGDSILYYDYGISPSGLDITGYTHAGTPANHIDSFLSNPIDHAKSIGATSTLNWNLDFATLTALASYDDGNSEWRFNDTGGPTALEVGHYGATAQQENFELRLSSKTDRTLSWIVGAAFYNDTETAHQQFYSPLLDPNLGDGPYGFAVNYWQNTRNAAVFGSLTWAFLPQWSISVGGRYTVEWLRDNLNNGAYLINPVAEETPQASIQPFISFAIQQATERSSEPTGELTLQYQPTDELNFYGKVSRGYRGGGFNMGTFSEPTIVQPEFVWAYEGGVKSSWLDGRLIANAALFKYDFSNLQIFSYVNFSATLKNAATAKYYGGDLSITYSPANNILLGVRGGVVSSSVYGYFNLGPDGNIYFIGPKSYGYRTNLSASLFGSYLVDLSDRGTLALYVEGDLRPQDLANPTRLNDPIYSIYYHDPYWVGNARLTYAPPNGNWDVALWIKNISNTQEVRGPASYLAFQLGSYTYTDPRRFGITITSKF